MAPVRSSSTSPKPTLEPTNVRPQVAADRRGGRVQQTALFGPEHVEQLAAPRHQRGERLGGRIGQGHAPAAAPRRRTPRAAAHRGRRSWRERLTRLGIRAHLARIDHGDAQAGAGTRGRRRGFVAARRLEHDERRGQRREARHEAVEGGGGRGAGPRGSARVHGDGELGFADVDADHGQTSITPPGATARPGLMRVRTRGPDNCSGSTVTSRRERPGWHTVSTPKVHRATRAL